MTKEITYRCDFCSRNCTEYRNMVHLAEHIGVNARYNRFDVCDICMEKYTDFTTKMKQTEGNL